MSNDTRMYTVDKFLGINQSADAKTKLRMGEASEMVNFTVTDGFNLKLRPGLRRVLESTSSTSNIFSAWAGKLGGDDLFAVYARDPELYDYVHVYRAVRDGFEHVRSQNLTRQDPGTASAVTAVKFFTFGGTLWMMNNLAVYAYDPENGFVEQEPYVPKVLIGTAPAGGGTTLENINLLSEYRRVEFNADGEAKDYVLPEEADSVGKIIVDNVEYPNASALGIFDAVTHTFSFAETAPAQGIGNVEITYKAKTTSETTKGKTDILRCRLSECYNGSTDTRLFVAGNGSNMCYYSGVTEAGKPDPTYFPAMNEINVNMDSSVITGLKRHFTKLLVFTRDGVYTITYEPVTLVDGSTIAGFFLRSASSGIGNEAMGQIELVDNYPRSLDRGGVYEWKITSSFYRDERNAQRISDRVEKTLGAHELSRAVTCDDGHRKEYWVFLNDAEGTILVHRYGVGKDGVWCVYKCGLCSRVTTANMCGDKLVITTQTGMFWFDDEAVMDDGETWRDEQTGIPAVWESDYMDFGANFRRKYSSVLYVNMLPQEDSELIVTAQTDKRSDYLEKTVTYEEDLSPRIRRIRLKTKKFVFYKLIMRIDTPGKQATVLGYDQQVRFASMAK